MYVIPAASNMDYKGFSGVRGGLYSSPSIAAQVYLRVDPVIQYRDQLL